MYLTRLLPIIDKEYTGPKAAYYFLIVIALASTARSLIHIIAPDGGANSIAGIALDAGSGPNIIAVFAQWGVSQVILALVYWLVILRYRFLTPLALVVIVLEQTLRIGAGMLKPLEVAAPPPGAIGSELILPMALIALVISLWGRK